jgi:ubiquinol oxidase
MIMISRPPIITVAAAVIIAASSSSSLVVPSAAFTPVTQHLRSVQAKPRRDAGRLVVLRMDPEEVNGSSSSTSTIDDTTSTSWNIGNPSPKIAEEAQKKLIAKKALTKLLERQQNDVQQTLDLIANLELEGYEHSLYESEDDDNVNNDSISSTASLQQPASIAASIAAGADYGYISRSEGCRVPYNKYDNSNNSNNNMMIDERFQEYGPPSNIFSLGSQQFMRNLRAMFNEYKDEEDNLQLTPRQIELQEQLSTLTLNSTAIWEREESRGPLLAPLIIKIPYLTLCYLLDVIFENRNPFSRFFLLETVARMPYFSYITMLHLYETLGFWRRSADIKRIHFAEEWNEFHHLLIMESLGGDQPYYVRFMAQHSALVYYLVLCGLWMASPSLSYKFSEMLETHAVDTYGQFIDENEEKLKKLPPSMIAVEYYTVGLSDPMFGEYQTRHGTVQGGDSSEAVASILRGKDGQRINGVRKPGTNMKSLYDVFTAIRNDEGDHVNTMQSCLDPSAPTLSSGLESRVLTGVALAAATSYLFGNYPGFDSLNGIMDGLSTLTSSGVGGDALVDGLAETMTSDLDQVLTDTSSDAPGIINGIVGGLAGLANGLNEAGGESAVEVDEDAITDTASSALEDMAAGGMEGFEFEAIMDTIRSIIVAILELTPFV